jgi:hypothetical protein
MPRKHYGEPSGVFNIFFVFVDCCNMLRGFFIFVIFICKRRVKMKIKRFLFCRFQGKMFGEADQPLTDVMFSRQTRWDSGVCQSVSLPVMGNTLLSGKWLKLVNIPLLNPIGSLYIGDIICLSVCLSVCLCVPFPKYQP